MASLFKKATDPLQYDKSHTGWRGLTPNGLDSPVRRAHFWNFIEPFSKNWPGKRLLDIGSGTGWLLDVAYKIGATGVIGIDPSVQNVEIASKSFPYLTSVNTSLEQYTSKTLFDVALAIYSLTHISDIDEGFKKISELLVHSGELIAIVPDSDYHRRIRYDYDIQFEELNDLEYVSAVKRPQGVIADVIRKISRYETAATLNGMELIDDVAMKPTQVLMSSEPKYISVRDITMTHLLRFKKK